MRLQRAFVAAYGPDRGGTAVGEALGYAWEHWRRVRRMENPIGYLYHVWPDPHGPRKTPTELSLAAWGQAPAAEHLVEPGLLVAIASLSEAQRVAVVLVHGYEWTLREVAELTGVTVSTVQTHVERGLVKLTPRWRSSTMADLSTALRELIERSVSPIDVDAIVSAATPPSACAARRHRCRGRVDRDGRDGQRARSTVEQARGRGPRQRRPRHLRDRGNACRLAQLTIFSPGSTPSIPAYVPPHAVRVTDPQTGSSRTIPFPDLGGSAELSVHRSRFAPRRAHPNDDPAGSPRQHPRTSYLQHSTTRGR